MPEPVTAVVTIALLSGVVVNVARDLVKKYLTFKKSENLTITIKAPDGSEQVVDFEPTDQKSIKKVLNILRETDGEAADHPSGK